MYGANMLLQFASYALRDWAPYVQKFRRRERNCGDTVPTDLSRTIDDGALLKLGLSDASARGSSLPVSFQGRFFFLFVNRFQLGHCRRPSDRAGRRRKLMTFPDLLGTQRRYGRRRVLRVCTDARLSAGDLAAYPWVDA